VHKALSKDIDHKGTSASRVCVSVVSLMDWEYMYSLRD
jgi:hypothetical protein